MDIKVLKASILQNNIPNFMIFSVNEANLCKQYINMISKTLNLPYKFYDSCDEVLYETSTNLKDSYLYIVLNDDKVIKNPKYVEELKKKTDRYIILYYTNLDYKCDLYKLYSQNVVIFKKLDKYTILAYLMKQLEKNKIDVDQRKVEKLIEFCNCDMGCCVNEIEKIITLNQSNSNMVFDYMLNNGFSDYRQTDLFAFIQKILNKDLTLYDDLMRLDESVIGLLFNLYNAAQKRLENDTENMRYVDIMRLCSFLDSGIKDGTISDAYALNYLLLKVC